MTKIEGQTARELVFGSDAGPQHSEHKRKARNLSQLLSSNPAVPSEVIPGFLSVMSAVEAAHEVSSEPLNLDPREIRFRGDGTTELSVSNTPSSGLTVVLGSSKYSTPEMFEETAGSVDNGPRDCYMLGFIFYEILLGADIFERQFQDVQQRGELGWLTWHADRTKHAKLLSELISGFPYSLSRLIEGMMAKEAAKRTTDLKKVSQAIGGALQATQVYNGSSGMRGDEAFASRARGQDRKPSHLRRWLGLSARGGFWKALWNRIFPGDHEAEPHGGSARESRERFNRVGASPGHGAETSVHPLDKSKRGPERWTS
jgi:hypothetical protein